MIKWFFVLSGLAVSAFLMMRYAPSLFSLGFRLGGTFIPYAAFAGLGILYLGAKLKSK